MKNKQFEEDIEKGVKEAVDAYLKLYEGNLHKLLLILLKADLIPQEGLNKIIKSPLLLNSIFHEMQKSKEALPETTFNLIR